MPVKILLVMAVVLLSACAYSPQQIAINPQVTLDGEVYGQGRVVHVLVEDQRQQKVIGTRGGAYPDTSVITLSNDIKQAVAATVQQGLQQQGFVVDTSQVPTATVKVIVDTLNYENDKEAITAKVNLSSILRLEVSVADKIHRGQYKSTSAHQLVVSPSAEKNERLINEVLAQTLQRLLLDPRVRAFLSNS